MDPVSVFRTDHYKKITDARIAHLLSLGLDLTGKSVLELGAGVGDFTRVFLERGCAVTATDARECNLDVIRKELKPKYGHWLSVEKFDIESGILKARQFDIIFCYGLLYHLRHPMTALAIAALTMKNDGLFLLETCVEVPPYPTARTIRFIDEDVEDPTASNSGKGCRPTPLWLWDQLDSWPHKYAPLTQPDHEEFPLKWSEPNDGLNRIVLLGSGKTLDLPTLSKDLPDCYARLTLPRIDCSDSNIPGPAQAEPVFEGVPQAD